MMSQAVHETLQALPGHLPVRARTSVLLAPRGCGELKVGAGRLFAGGRTLAPGHRVHLLAGDSIEVTNPSVDSRALYSWELCATQPTASERLRRRLVRLARTIGWKRSAQLRECGPNGWCLAG